MENKEIKLQPVVSEKSYNLANASNKYTFLVTRGNNKIEIGKAVEKKYKVHVEKVNSVVKPGKSHRNPKTNGTLRKSDLVKFVVTLKKGDKIDEFLNI
jgi:large subunit ribosomal protein L23